jgi:ubiquinol oxidase
LQLLESHAVDTYDTFVKQNKERLMTLPAPKVATSYYKSADLYLFDDFQVSRTAGARRPPCDNLYDVFKNICDDETEHVKTMIACQEYARSGTLIVSPHAGFQERTATEPELEVKRRNWKEWAESINEMDSYESSSSTTEFE